MRTLMALAVALFVGGCGDDTSKLQTDMAVALVDMTVPADMAKLTCAQIISCAQACGTDLVCAGGCVAKGSANGQMKFGALSQCVIALCVMDAGACTSTQCQQCVQQAGIAAATNPNAPCHAEFVTCEMN